jgi:hypothetical protein
MTKQCTSHDAESKFSCFARRLKLCSNPCTREPSPTAPFTYPLLPLLLPIARPTIRRRCLRLRLLLHGPHLDARGPMEELLPGEVPRVLQVDLGPYSPVLRGLVEGVHEVLDRKVLRGGLQELLGESVLRLKRGVDVVGLLLGPPVVDLEPRLYDVAVGQDDLRVKRASFRYGISGVRMYQPGWTLPLLRGCW